MFPDLSADRPAGENLELDLEYGELERAARGRPETQYGDTITPATPPDWRETETIALSLLQRTRDLRIIIHLAIARLHLGGIAAYSDMLTQIRLQLENRWAEVHPQLDAEDGNDPTLRANALYQLRDPQNVLRTLREVPLATTAKTGPICWRDIALFNGAIEPEPGQKKPTEALIRGAFELTDQPRLAVLRAGVAQAIHEAAAIPEVFEARAGRGTGPNLTDLSKMLGNIQKELQRFAVVATAPETADEANSISEPEAEPEHADAPEPAAPPPRRAAARAISSATTREDALYLLELASAYFQAHEPSSPIPLLLARAQRLARMDFMEILRDLAPDGVNQVQIIAGPKEE